VSSGLPGTAQAYDQAAVLARLVGARMAERLDYMKISPQRMADIGCATGDGIRALHARYSKAQALAIDVSLPMLHGVRAHDSRLTRLLNRVLNRGPQLVNADARALPLADNTVDFVWSNLMLHWLDDPLPALREIHRIMAVGGLVMFATLGPDSLLELRSAMEKVMRSGIQPDGADGTVRRFIDMHDIGDMLVAAGFADPVMDMEIVNFTYRHPRQFLADQRHLGVRDAFLGQQSFHTWRKIFSAWPCNHEERWPLRFEIVYGHAWKPAPRLTLQATPQYDAAGNAIVTFHPR